MRVIDKEIPKAPSATEIYANAVSHGSTGGNHILAAAFSKEAFGRSLVRLKYASEADEYAFCLQHLNWVALGKNRKWKAEVPKVRQLTKRVMDYWIADTCPECLGRGAKQIEGTPHLSQICPACVSGLRKWEQAEPYQTYGRELLGVIEEHAARFGGMLHKYASRK